jgi:anti-anti-sigma factor
MQITWHLRNCLTILELTGRCVASSGDRELLPFRDAITRLVGERRVNVALDLRGISAFDARGLGELVTTYHRLREACGSLRLIEPTAYVRKLLAVTRLDSFIPIDESSRVSRPDWVDGATASLAPALVDHPKVEVNG